MGAPSDKILKKKTSMILRHMKSSRVGEWVYYGSQAEATSMTHGGI